MKLTSFAATAIAVALLSAGSVMADETLKTGDSHSMDKWYGRAGGPVGAGRSRAATGWAVRPDRPTRGRAAAGRRRP